MGKLSDEAYNKKVAKAPRDFEVFVDMDGVLSDFDRHATAHGKYNDKGQPKWDALDYDWWSTMPAFQGMKDFYNKLKETGNVRILTSPTLSVGCFQGKADWTVKQWGKWGLGSLIICRSADKQFLARPNHILIDDRIKNVDEWSAAGGIGILHKGDYAETLKRLDEATAAFKAQRKKDSKPPAPKP